MEPDFHLQAFCTIWLLAGIFCCASPENIESFSVKSEDHSKGGHFGAKFSQVTLNLQQSIATIGPRFVGVTIDTGMVPDNWETLDFSSPKVQNLARALTPTYFRLGGTPADCLMFDPNAEYDQKMLRRTKRDQTANLKYTSDLRNFTMSASQWIQLNEFVQTVGWDFIMDLNALLRKPDGSWDPSNARKLLQFSAARNFTIVGFELGNEYEYYMPTFNRSVSPEQLARDVKSLQKLLGEFPQYYSSFIIGPETVCCTMLLKYFFGFLADGGAGIVDASSFHHYYFEGKTAKVEYFTDIGVLNSFRQVENGIKLSRSVNPQLPVWLSETSSAYGGGATNISDRFVAGFLWLDKLGLSASMGIQTVIRQDFYGHNYALIDADLNPNPDYWLTLLHKKLVRGSVFNVSGSYDARMYAACANSDSFSKGALTVYFLNPKNYGLIFDLPQFTGQKQLLWILTAGDENGLLSKFSALNGVKLEMRGNDLPSLPPIPSLGPVAMPPYSFGFVVLPDVRLSLCLTG